jgi:hypothetical protein
MSEERSDGMRFLLSQNSRFNELIPTQDIALTDWKLLNIAPPQLSEKIA